MLSKSSIGDFRKSLSFFLTDLKILYIKNYRLKIMITIQKQESKALKKSKALKNTT